MDSKTTDAEGKVANGKGRIWIRAAALVAVLALVVAGAIGLGLWTPGGGYVAGQTVVIDARTPAEFAASHVEGAINIDATAPGLATEVAALNSRDNFIVYCATGVRASGLVRMMRAEGLDVVNAHSPGGAARLTNRPLVAG